MTKKIIVVMTFALLSLAVTQYQIQRINHKTLQTYEDVCVYTRDIEYGTVLKASDIAVGKINTQWDSADYIKDSTTAVGMQLKTDVKKNAILAAGNLSEANEAMLPSEGRALTAIKLSSETAVGWSFEAGDTMVLYWVGTDATTELMGDVFIKAIISETGAANASPVYVIVETDVPMVAKIVSIRDKGRFELVRQFGLIN
ncbi:SAF domain-containing protein [Fusibacter paucivorans]|uniref:SAF domain-containing protein n=1 Tax=Fusibacter paucivorans TaxID=76009 RepID=A0ABS5PMZ5_9FIRM|nr:SAF domain-containing protein [Fusibacter paucivorans]MBS7526553.1 SAF domain-containing protein [Fusibacter paucivorans]